MKKRDSVNEPEVENIDDKEIKEKEELEDGVSEDEESVKPISALFSFIVYLVSFVIGVVVYLITDHRIAIPFIGMLPAVLFVPYAIFGKRKRQWGVFFGVWEGFSIIVLYYLLKILIKYTTDSR